MYVTNKAFISEELLLDKEKKIRLFGRKKFLLYPLGRNALYYGLKQLNISKGDTVLLPSFLCRTIVEGFDYNVKFYNVKRDFSADQVDIEKKIDENTKAVMIIHYQGFPQNIKEISKICKECDVFLIEDCARALFSKYRGKRLGFFGDIGFYSIRKVIPSVIGGALVINNKNIDSPSHKSVKISRRHEEFVNDRIEKFKKNYYNFKRDALKRDRENWIKDKWVERELFKNTSIYFDLPKPIKNIMANVNEKQIIKKRVENFKLLSEILDKHIERIFDELPKGICPINFPILIDNRNKIRNLVWDKGIETLIHWDSLMPEKAKKNPNTMYLAKHELSLPVHHDLEEEHIRWMSSEINKILR